MKTSEIVKAIIDRTAKAGGADVRKTIWVVEVRDNKRDVWFPASTWVCESRSHARANQHLARRMWRFTRIAKYVREEA